MHQGYEVIPSTKRNFLERILARKYEITFELDVLFLSYVFSIVFEVAVRHAKIDEVDFVH